MRKRDVFRGAREEEGWWEARREAMQSPSEL